jgi:hypothetical protein
VRNLLAFGMCVYFTGKRRCFKLFMACYNGVSIFGMRVVCWGGMDMKQIRPFAIVLFILLWLAACVRENEGVVETAVAPTPSATMQPTVTGTAVSTTSPATLQPTLIGTPVPMSVATETAVVTAFMTPVSLFGFEPEADGSPYPTIPISDTNPSNYQLTEPNSTILFQILVLTMLETCNRNTERYYLRDYAVGDLFRMFKFEYDNLTEDELKNTIWLIQNTDSCLGEGFSYYVPAIIPKALQVGVVQFLNQNQIKFEPLDQTLPEFDFRAIPIDFDQQYTEWLVEATFIRYDLRIFVPIYEDDFGTYHLIPNDLTPQQMRNLFSRELKHNIDLTGDGVDEIIVVTRIDGSTAGGYPGFIEIFSWNDGFIQTLNILWIGDERSFSAAFDTEYTIADFNNDLVPDIEVINPHYDFDFPECNWVERHLYSWQGTEVTSTIEFLEEPNKSECASSDIEYAGSSLLIDSNFLVDSFVFDDSLGYVYDETDENLSRFVSNNAHIMQQQILSGYDLPYLQDVLQRTLDRMRAEESFFQPSHFLYLLGLNYELSGDAETAVSTYFDLIQQFPTSPWSWLAWARLEPVNP